MRLIFRVALAVTVAVAPAASALSSCGTDAVGSQACREIEYARCTVAPVCEPSFDVNACERFYRDECLLGIQNAAATGDLNAMGQACATQITDVANCAPGGNASAETCAMLIPDASCLEIEAGVTPCNIILYCPEVLTACSFVGSFAVTEDGGADADAADTDDAATDGGADAADGDVADAATD